MTQNILRENVWLAHQPAGFRDEVLDRGMVLRFTNGKPVFGVGDPPGGIYGILSGALAVSIAPRGTGPHLVHQSGAWLGEGSFLTGQPRRVGLEAVGDAALFCLPLTEMGRLSSNDPENTRRFGQIAMMNLDSCFGTMNDLLIRNPCQRVAATLVRFLGARQDGNVVITQSDLGLTANVSRKVVNQSLKTLTEAGLVRIGYAAVEVLDAGELRKFAHDDGL